MKHMKKACSLLLVALMVLSLAACGGGGSSTAASTVASTADGAAVGTAEDGSTASATGVHVDIGLTSDPGSFAPWDPSSDGKKMYAEMYETLFNYTQFGSDLVGIIGKSFEQLDDFTYRVYMYDYVTDANGKTITAADVVWSYDMCQQGGGYNNRVKDIESIEIVDDYTLDFTYTDVLDYASFCESMMIYIVSQETFEEIGEGEFALHPVATGPYVVDDYITGSYYTLVKNDQYWQKPDLQSVIQMQNCDSITYKLIAETAQMAISLESGEINMAAIDSDNIQYFYDVASETPLEGWYAEAQLSVPCYSLVLNCSDQSVLQNQDLRMAVLYAIDNEALLTAAANGEGKVEYTNGGQQYAGFQQAMVDAAATNCYSVDLEKSAEYLEAAGYAAGEATITIMTQNFTENVAVILQSQLLAAGINLNIVSYEPALYETYSTEADQWDIVLSFKGKSSGLLADFWGHHLPDYSYGSANMIHDETLQELYEACLGLDATDKEILACHEYFTDMGYFYGLFNNQSYYVAKEGVTSLAVSGQYGIIPGGCTYTEAFGQ